MMIDGWGVAVDRVISDFVQGTVEWMLEEGEERGDWLIVEGQGSLDHPAYSSVTLGLIHGATPHAMVMVHKPGPRRATTSTTRPTSRSRSRSCPSSSGSTRRWRGSSRPRRSSAIALNTMLYPDEDEARRVIEEIAAETGLPTDDPVRFGADRLWAAVREAVDALPWVARRAAGASAALAAAARRDPLAPARGPAPRACATRSGSPAPTTAPGHAVTTAGRRAARRPRSRASSGSARATRTGTTARRSRRWPRSSRCSSPRSARLEPTADGAAGRERRGSQAAIRWNGARQVRHRHGAPRPRRQGHGRAGLSRCSACRPTSRRRTSRSGSTSRRSSPSGPGAPARSRRSRSSAAGRRTSRRSRRSARSTTSRSASTPTPAGRPRRRAQLLPALVDLGVELIEQPFPAGRLDWLRDLQAGSPLPIVADESCVTIEDLDALVGVTAGVNVKLAKCGGPGPAARMLARAHELGLPDVPRLHGGDVGRDRGLGGGRLAGRLGRPRRQPAPRRRAVRRASSSATDHRWQLTDAPGLGVARRADRGRRPVREPTVWISWWTKRWTSPLPAKPPAAVPSPGTYRPAGKRVTGHLNAQPRGHGPSRRGPGSAPLCPRRDEEDRIDGRALRDCARHHGRRRRVHPLLLRPASGRLAGAV